MKYLTIFFLFLGCNETGSPEGFLEKYIKYRFSKNQSMEKILGMVDDPLKSKFLSLENEDRERFLETSELLLKRVRIISKNCAEQNSCFLTYEVKYETLSPDKTREFTTEVKKIALMNFVDKEWKIADINNIKTFHDAHQEITP